MNRERRTVLKPEALNPLARSGLEFLKVRVARSNSSLFSSRRKSGVARASVRAAYAANKGVRGVQGVAGGQGERRGTIDTVVPLAGIQHSSLNWADAGWQPRTPPNSVEPVNLSARKCFEVNALASDDRLLELLELL